MLRMSVSVVVVVFIKAAVLRIYRMLTDTCTKYCTPYVQSTEYERVSTSQAVVERRGEKRDTRDTST